MLSGFGIMGFRIQLVADCCTLVLELDARAVCWLLVLVLGPQNMGLGFGSVNDHFRIGTTCGYGDLLDAA